MELTNRIERIKEYFDTFNICDGIAYIRIKLPKKWSLFDSKNIGSEFNVTIEERKEGVYFLCDINNGTECLFDAAEYIIRNNKTLEEKTALFQVKIKELGEIFSAESLERLKTLEFTFPKKQGKVIRHKTIPQIIEKVEQPVEEVAKQEQAVEKELKTEPVKKETGSIKKSTKKKVNKEEGTNKKEEIDSSLMEFAKELIGDE